MTRLGIFRSVAALASASLLALSVLGGTASAANARDVYFGSPPPGTGGDFTPGGLVFGTLTNTPVNIGGQTAIPLRVANEGGQSLNHVKWAAGTAADNKPYNPLFPRPDLDGVPGPDPSLPGTTTITRIYVTSGSATCNPDAGASVECTIGSLAAGAEVNFLVIVKPPAAAGSYRVWFTGSWNEGWSSTGTNADYQFATGTIAVNAATCTDAADYFLDDEDVNLATLGTSCALATSIAADAVLGVGTFASIKVGASSRCAGAFTCFGDESTVSVLGGLPVTDGVAWTMRWTPAPKPSPKGVIHFGDDFATNPLDFDAILFNKQGECKGEKKTNCWTEIISTRTYFEATFITPENGGARGILK